MGFIAAELDSVMDDVLKKTTFTQLNGMVTLSQTSWLNALEKGEIIGWQGGTSGGYAEYIVNRFIAEKQRQPLLVNRTTKYATASFDPC